MRFRSLAAAVAAAVVSVPLWVPALGSPATAAERREVASVTFVGRGYGHGVGMSQYGARNRANAGQGWQRIVRFYYPHTKLGRVAGSIRVLLTADTSADVVVVARSGLSVRSLGAKQRWTLPTRIGGKAVSRWRITATGGGARSQISYRTDGWHAWRKPKGAAEFAAGGAPVTLVTPTGRASYRGALRSAASDGGRVTVNVLPLETYLRGVVAEEVPGEWPQAAVRAQSVAARSYAAYERAHTPASRAYDICDTTSCQVYAGVAGEYPKADTAIRATARRLVTFQGAPAFTQFSSSNGGWTAAGGFRYLAAKKDTFDHGDPADPWRVTFSAAEIARVWPGLGTLESVRVTERDGHGSYGGRALTVRITGSDASVTASGAQLMSYLGLRSSLFRIT